MAFNLFGKKKREKAPEAISEAEVPQTKSIPAAPAGSVLRRFFISEKSARGLTHNQYTFVVSPRATKTQVRDAVQQNYNVKVVAVTMVRLPAKRRFVGRHLGATPGIKKATVTLKQGDSIAQAQA